MPASESDSSALGRLLLQANNGDHRAYEQLIERSAERLQALARAMLRQYPRLRRWEETDDVFQNATLRLYRSLEDVRPESPRQFFGLAATQVRRTLIDLVRHHFGPLGHATHHDTHVRDGSRPPRDFTDENAGPETLADWTQFHEVVEQLPDEEQEAFSLVWYSGMTQKEAADVLEISERTMIRRMNRARLLIHDAVSGTQDETDNA